MLMIGGEGRGFSTGNDDPGIGVICEEAECGGLGVVGCWAGGFVCVEGLFVLLAEVRREEMPAVEGLVVGSDEVEWLNLGFCWGE